MSCTKRAISTRLRWRWAGSSSAERRERCMRIRSTSICLLSAAIALGACSSSSSSSGNPAIDTQPADVTVVAGAAATFSVQGSGADAFQWLKNGLEIAGATAASYTTPPTAAADDQAVFSVKLSKGASSVTSADAKLRVNYVTLGTQLPAGLVVAPGEPATFTVGATGSGTLAYQWRKGATDIAGATAATLYIASAAGGDTATYTCVVTSALNGTSAKATATTALTVLTAPQITTQPQGGTIFPN